MTAPLRRILLVSAMLFAAISATGTVNPNGEREKNPCECGCENGQPIKSFEWSVNVGKARYKHSSSFTSLANISHEGNGNLPTFAELHRRMFSSKPLQQDSVSLKINQPRINGDTFHPSCLFLQSEPLCEILKKPAVNGFSEYIHQIVTDDTFTLIDLLPEPDSGWRLRVWKRDTAALTKADGFYVTTGFENSTSPPLEELIFKRPSGSSSNDTLIIIQKETTGLAGTRIVTEQLSQTFDTNGKPDIITDEKYIGEGTGGSMISKELVDYDCVSGAKAWDYTIVREVYTSSVDAAGNIGALTLTARTREDYDDFSTTEIGGELGMKRLVSQTEAYEVSGQTAQTTTYTYIDQPTNSAVHGRLQSVVKPDGSWTFNEYFMSPGNPVSIATEYSGWKDCSIAGKASARKKVTTISANDSTEETFVGGQLVAKTKNTLVMGTIENLTTSEQWDGNAWHITTTAYYSDDATAPNTGRIHWIENSDGTATIYNYATGSGKLIVTACSGAGTRSAITAGTETKTTYNSYNIPIAQITKDIASGLVTERWITDETYHSGFDASGRPIKRIYNNDATDYDITE